MTESTVVVTGATGQLGRCLVDLGAVAVSRDDLDLATAGPTPGAPETEEFREAAADLVTRLQPDVIVNTAAWTDVDGAEDPGATATVEAVNTVAPAVLAEVARDAGARFIHISTEYVFSGEPTPPGRGWRPEDTVRPENEYGRTKAEGERGVLAADGTVVRTSWVWSGPSAPRRDFVAVMASLAENGVDPKVVDDQVGRPTYAPDLAAELWSLAVGDPTGTTGTAGTAGTVLHLSNSGDPVTWFGLAREVFRFTGHDPDRVTPCTTADWPTPALRPPWSMLDLQSWHDSTGRTPPAWQDALQRGLGVRGLQ